MMRPSWIEFSQQIVSLLGGFLVVKGLIMRKRNRSVENMHHASHIRMNKADQLEITRRRKHHVERLTRDHRRSANTRRVVE